jgi:sec-independent protein translocase protein TatA
MFGNIGMSELLIIFVVVLLLFGPKKLPELARGLGRSIQEFKKAADDVKKELNVMDDFKKP